MAIYLLGLTPPDNKGALRTGTMGVVHASVAQFEMAPVMWDLHLPGIERRSKHDEVKALIYSLQPFETTAAMEEAAQMLRVKKDTGEELEVNTIQELLPMIPADVQDSLKAQIHDESAFNSYLEEFIAQNRRTTARSLVKDVSTAVCLLHLKSKDDVELPGHPGGYMDWVMFHYLYPDAHATGGKDSDIWKQAKDAIGRAQGEWHFNGSAVLNLYADYAQFFLEQGIDAGNVEKLAELRDEARKGSSVEAYDGSSLEQVLNELPTGKPFIMPFGYGGHQTYIRLSYVKPSYRLEYFDRQRQTLTLRGNEIPGYLQGIVMTAARPVYFDFAIEPKSLSSICQKAQSIATGQTKPDEILANGPRQQVLELFAGTAKDVAVLGSPEPAQHPDAINCAWASLESIIRLSLGPEDLQKQVDFMREVVVTRYIAGYGEPAEKAAAGLF